VQRAYIGVSIRDMDQKLAEETGLDRIRGVYVNGITEGGAAQKAGMEAGDVIVKVGSIEVNNVTQLQEQVGKFRPGNRAGDGLRKDREAGVRHDPARQGGHDRGGRGHPSRFGSATLGAEVRPASGGTEGLENWKHGVKVTTINGGKFRSSGIKKASSSPDRPGTHQGSPANLEIALENKRGGVLVEGVYPNGTRAYYGLGL
jgi:serine protease Do